MPALLTHFNFGVEAIKGLPTTILNIIDKHKEEYILGLQGPDMLFFYKPYFFSNVSKIGLKIHDNSGKSFFQKGKEVYSKDKNEGLFAYILGCTCHYFCDSKLHPVIDLMAQNKSPEHHQIEAELDLYVSQIKNLKYPRNTYLPKKISCYEKIGELYGMTSQMTYRALEDYNLFSSLLENRNNIRLLEKIVCRKPYLSCMSKPNSLKYSCQVKALYSNLEQRIYQCSERIEMMVEYFYNGCELEKFDLDFNGNS